MRSRLPNEILVRVLRAATGGVAQRTAARLACVCKGWRRAAWLALKQFDFTFVRSSIDAEWLTSFVTRLGNARGLRLAEWRDEYALALSRLPRLRSLTLDRNAAAIGSFVRLTALERLELPPDRLVRTNDVAALLSLTRLQRLRLCVSPVEARAIMSRLLADMPSLLLLCVHVEQHRFDNVLPDRLFTAPTTRCALEITCNTGVLNSSGMELPLTCPLLALHVLEKRDEYWHFRLNEAKLPTRVQKLHFARDSFYRFPLRPFRSMSLHFRATGLNRADYHDAMFDETDTLTEFMRSPCERKRLHLLLQCPLEVKKPTDPPQMCLGNVLAQGFGLAKLCMREVFSPPNHLHGNPLFHTIARYFPEIRGLRCLELHGCVIDGSLLNALARTTTLRRLALHWCVSNDVALLHRLGSLTWLSVLRIEALRVPGESVAALIRWLETALPNTLIADAGPVMRKQKRKQRTAK
ncbi:Hypothetical protein UVM_LOCUS95 [uncultured virus]|nr:Hypothetical protein UVM_LOCUS95 [uncultured virus]